LDEFFDIYNVVNPPGHGIEAIYQPVLGVLWQIWRDVDQCFSPRSSGKLVRRIEDMRSSERRVLCIRFWSGRLFLMFCSCFEVDND